ITDSRQDSACTYWLSRGLLDFHWSMIFRLAEDGDFEEAAKSVDKARSAARSLKEVTGSKHYEVMMEIYPAAYFILRGEDSSESYDFEEGRKHLTEAGNLLD